MKSVHTSIVAGIFFALALAAPTSAWGSIPVACEDNLDIPGAQYKLTADLNCPGNGVVIQADNIHLNLSGYSIVGTGAFNSVGIRVANPNPGSSITKVHIQGGTVRGFATGILLMRANQSQVNGMTLSGNLIGGLRLESSHDNQINGNTSTGNFYGMELYFSNRNRIHGNVMTFNLTGIRLGDCCRWNNENLITSNILSFNNDGAPTNGFASVGIVFHYGSNNIARGNTVNGNEVGILVNRGSDNLIQGNTANENTFYGIVTGFFGPLVPGTRIQGNTATNNTTAGPLPFFVPVPPGPVDLMDFQLLRTGASQIQWKSNIFVTDSEGDGPGAGWIR